jgi:hypothetical protein
MTRKVWARLAIVLTLAAALGLPLATSQATTRLPTVHLLSVLRHVHAERFDGDPILFVDAGIYAAAADGAFEVDATAAGTSIALWQVRRDHDGVHRIRRLTAPVPVSLSDGLPNFFHVVLRDATGKRVSTSNLPFCPGAGFGLSRTEASGPDHPTYPYGCGDLLTQAAVWGMDRGWATALGLELPASDIADGKYVLQVSIAATWVEQLQIPSRDASASVDVKVTTLPGKCTPQDPCAPLARLRAARTALAAQTEGPHTVRPDAVPSDGGLGGHAGVPDLRALPAHDLSATHHRSDGHDYLNFGATIWNAGSGPLVVEGFRAGDTPVMAATQFIYQNGKPVRSKVVGQFEFDTRAGHHHWHMEDIAQYDLLDASGHRIVLSDKQSFCLAPTDPIDLTAPGSAWQPDQAMLWSACSGEDAIWLREVLPAGWGDTYYQSVAGQSFDITGLANGHYQVRVTTDPNNRLLETSYANNVGLVKIVIGGTAGKRTVSIVG